MKIFILLIFFLLLPNSLASSLQAKQRDDFDANATPDLTPIPTLSPTSPSKKGLSAVLLIVIIVTVVAVGSLLITLLVFWIIKKARTYGHDLEENLMGDSLNSFHQNS